MQILAAVPLRQSISPKSRLASVLSPETRRLLSLQMAARVIEAIAEGGARPLILAADHPVMDWAEQRGWETILDRMPSLNAAAAGAVERAARLGLSWMVIHADLPLLSRADIRAAVETIAAGGWVLAPSSDGGTSLVGGPRDTRFEFAYGRGSFHRHLARLQDRAPRVLYRLGLALDLDRPSDLRAALSHPRGGWLAGTLTETERDAVGMASAGNLR